MAALTIFSLTTNLLPSAVSFRTLISRSSRTVQTTFKIHSFDSTRILWGGLIIIHPQYYSDVYKTYMDFTSYNIPLGLFMSAVGIHALWPTSKVKN